MRGAPGERRDLAEVRHRAQAFAFMSAPIDTPCYVDRLARNWLCGLTQHGSGIYTAEGITKLCEGLKGSAVTSLECAAALRRLLLCQRPLTILLPFPGSLSNNVLCGKYTGGLGGVFGTYTAEGITKLCEGLKGSAVTSLECATPRPERLLSCQRPLTLRTTKHSSALAVCDITASVPKEEPRLQRASRATQHCKCSSKPTGTRTG